MPVFQQEGGAPSRTKQKAERGYGRNQRGSGGRGGASAGQGYNQKREGKTEGRRVARASWETGTGPNVHARRSRTRSHMFPEGAARSDNLAERARARGERAVGTRWPGPDVQTARPVAAMRPCVHEAIGVSGDGGIGS